MKPDEIDIAAIPQISAILDQMRSSKPTQSVHASVWTDGGKKPKESTDCLEHCAAPARNAAEIVKNEIGDFQEKHRQSLKVCKDRFERAKARGGGGDRASNYVLPWCLKIPS